MACSSCSQKTLGLFIRSFINTELPLSSRLTSLTPFQSARLFSATRRLREADQTHSEVTQLTPGQSPTHKISRRRRKSTSASEAKVGLGKKKPEQWQIQKAAVKEKLGNESWNPRKKLSPDAMEGIRHLHQTAPHKFTTALLAQHFRVSPEAIRRILKSKWRPSDEEQEERMRRWDKRGERIWSNLVELGVKPPKKWREMGVGRAQPGGIPKWKSKARNTVAVESSFNEDLIPIIDKDSDSARSVHWRETRFSERL
ncbi:hypothetical protein CC78DRAFT_319502 [Lojkania enalia]|uniref:Required for respiratory growth protein 9, mitochondrial n=1 Tax=Lojkania enalia TaxID=147567 RepID=A0A9P4N299_9PLEO|nr:hypothetical protein CC78DRAFT_319502 [Didymosphaeria enalia]